MKEAAMARAGLRDIVSLADRAAVMGLRRGPGQDQYLDSMEEIFGEADEQQRAMPRPWAVHDAETGALVGFAMISDNIPQPMDDDLVGPYYLWKLLIDHRCQGRGYGAATLDAIAGYLATRPGDALEAVSAASITKRGQAGHRAGSPAQRWRLALLGPLADPAGMMNSPAVRRVLGPPVRQPNWAAGPAGGGSLAECQVLPQRGRPGRGRSPALGCGAQRSVHGELAVQPAC
jgi:diamine N-acetyltransferase